MFPRLHYSLLRVAVILVIGLSACASLSEPTATPTPAPPTQTAVPPTSTPPPLAAIVNGEWITEAEFQAELDRFISVDQAVENNANSDQVARFVLDDMIAQVLFSQAAREDGFELTESELEARIESLALEIGGLDALATWQSDHGYTDKTFLLALKQAAEAAWMRDKIITAVPGTTEQVHAQQILLYNEDAARQVAGQLDAGVSFAELAVLYDPTTGGELGWFPRGYLLEPELEKAAFSLEPGQHSDVIKTEVGYHILLVVERDLQHQLSPDAYLVMQEKALQDWLVQKRAESDIVLTP